VPRIVAAAEILTTPTIAGPDLEAAADEFDEPEQDRRDGGAGGENARRPSERPALLVTPARFERATLRFEVRKRVINSVELFAKFLGKSALTPVFIVFC
jgi:hypothetical protein